MGGLSRIDTRLKHHTIVISITFKIKNHIINVLQVHKKIHTDDRQYTCEHCGKSYIQKHDMIKHKKVHDPKSKPFFCKYCGNSFAHKRDFSRHAICHYDYIRKSNSDIGTAEKILETVAGELPKNSRSFIEAERLFLESTDELVDEKFDKSDIT